MIILGFKYVFVCWNKWEFVWDLYKFIPFLLLHQSFLWWFCFPSKQPAVKVGLNFNGFILVVHACYLSVLNECYRPVYHYRHVAAKLSVGVHAAVRGTVVPAARPAGVTRQPVWTAKVVIHMIQTRAQNRWVVLIIYLSIKMSNDNN